MLTTHDHSDHDPQEPIKVYQHQQMQLIAKPERNAEQEQQNNANAQGQLSNVPEQQPMGLQLGAQRPHQTSTGANNMPQGEGKIVNGSFVLENSAAALHQQPPTQEQIQHAMLMIHQLKTIFQQRSLPGMNLTHHIPDEQRLEYNQVLEQVYKMTADMDLRLHMYYAIFKSEDLLRKYVAIVMTVARQRQLLSTSSPQYIIPLVNLQNMQLQIHKLNEEFEKRWRAMKAFSMAARTEWEGDE